VEGRVLDRPPQQASSNPAAKLLILVTVRTTAVDAPPAGASDAALPKGRRGSLPVAHIEWHRPAAR